MLFVDPGAKVQANVRLRRGSPAPRLGLSMTSSANSSSTRFRFCTSLVLNSLVAIFGVAALSAPFGGIFHFHSISAILWRAWSLSVLFGLLAGFFVYRIFRPAAAKWIWVLPALWFGLRVLLFLGAGLSLKATWEAVSGNACGQPTAVLGCQLTFFVFTIPLLRCMSYAVGAYVGSRFPLQGPSPYAAFRAAVVRLNRF
jgi:hypothetical protein